MITHMDARLLSLSIVGAALISTSSSAQESPYDYYSRSSCGASNTSDPRSVYGDPSDGSVTNFSVISAYLLCPIMRIYPRHPGRLEAVEVDLQPSEKFSSFARDVRVCAMSADGGEEAVCVEVTIPPYSGSWAQRVSFDRTVFTPVRTAPPGWNYYMYIVIQQHPEDKLYGYRTYWDLR